MNRNVKVSTWNVRGPNADGSIEEQVAQTYGVDLIAIQKTNLRGEEDRELSNNQFFSCGNKPKQIRSGISNK